MDNPPRRSTGRLGILAGVLALVVVFVVGVLVGGHPEATGLTSLPTGIRGVVLGAGSGSLIADIETDLREGYYVPVNSLTLERASVDGMLASLHDPYTYYLDPADYAAMERETQGEFVGIGIQVLQRGSDVVITSVFAGSPAHAAGLEAGDVIVGVNGHSVVGSPLATAVSAIRGPNGSTVGLTVRTPAGATKTASMRRTIIHLRLVDSKMLEIHGRKIGHIGLVEFDQGAAADVRAAVASLTRQGATGFILDLRGNPGGLVNEAVDLVGVFVPKGSPVVTTQGLHDPRETLTTTGTPATRLPLVVLVDRYSASASEIVSGALRDDGRALLVGQRTFGKAVVQTTDPLANGGALHLTIARYLTPKGFDLNHKGLEPNVVVVDNPKTPADEALQRALEVVGSEH
jgi:carboxyl-terminal processing protease